MSRCSASSRARGSETKQRALRAVMPAATIPASVTTLAPLRRASRPRLRAASSRTRLSAYSRSARRGSHARPPRARAVRGARGPPARAGCGSSRPRWGERVSFSLRYYDLYARRDRADLRALGTARATILEDGQGRRITSGAGWMAFSGQVLMQAPQPAHRSVTAKILIPIPPRSHHAPGANFRPEFPTITVVSISTLSGRSDPRSVRSTLCPSRKASLTTPTGVPGER